MEANRQANKGFMMTRAWTRFVFISAVIGFSYSVYIGNHSNEAVMPFLVVIISYLFLFALYVVKSKNKYYVPLISDMSVYDYWGVCGILLVLIRIIFPIQGLPENEVYRIFDVIAATVGVVFIFLAYSRRAWTARNEDLREKRIKYLARKAKLSLEELELARDMLAKEYSNQQKAPIVWSLAVWIAYFIVGVLITIVASYQMTNAVSDRGVVVRSSKQLSSAVI